MLTWLKPPEELLLLWAGICGWCLKNYNSFKTAVKIYSRDLLENSREQLSYPSRGVQREHTWPYIWDWITTKDDVYTDIFPKSKRTQFFTLKGFTAYIHSKRATLKMHASSGLLLHRKVLFFIKDSFPQTRKLTTSESVSFYKYFHSWHQSNAAGFRTTKQQLATLSC